MATEKPKLSSSTGVGYGNVCNKVAVDAKLTPSTDTDLFRIKIVDKTTDALVYDNQVVGETDDNADPTTVIKGGSIVIHKAK